MFKRLFSKQSRILHLRLGLSLAIITLLSIQATAVGVPFARLVAFLFLIPIVIVSHYKGMLQGLAVALASSLLIIPSLLLEGHVRSVASMSPYFQSGTILMFAAVAFLVSDLAGLRRRQEALNQAVTQLTSWLDKGLSVQDLIPVILEQASTACHAGGGVALWGAPGDHDVPVIASTGLVTEFIKQYDDNTVWALPLLALAAPAREAFDLPSRTNRISLDSIFSPAPAPADSLILLPFHGREGLLCLVCLFRDPAGSVSANDVEVAKALCKRGQAAVENAFLHEELNEKAARLAVTNRVASTITSSLDLRRTLKSIMDSIGEAMPGSTPAVYLYDEDSGGLQMQLLRDLGPGLQLRTGREAIRRLAEEVARSRSQLCLSGAMPTPDSPEEAGTCQPFAGSFVGVPLLLNERLVGVFCSWSERSGMFGKRELSFLAELAPHIAAAVSNAQLYHSTDSALAQRVQELSIIQAIGREFNSSLDPDHLLGLALEKAVELTGTDSGHIVLAEDGISGSKHPGWFSYQPFPNFPGEPQPPAIEQEVMERLSSTGQPIITDTGQTTGKRAFIPISCRGRMLGVLLLESHDDRAFEEAELSFLVSLANQAAPAIENADLFRKTQQRAHDTTLLLETSTLISSALSLDQTLHYLAQRMVASLGMAFCTITLLDEAGKNLTVRAGYHTGRDGGRVRNGFSFPLAEAAGHSEVVQTRQLLALPKEGELVELSGMEKEIAVSSKISSAILAPLVVEDNVVGVIFLGERRSQARAPVTPEKLDLCRAMAAHAAVAVEKARLYEAAVEENRNKEYIFQSMGDGVCTTDTGRIILGFNPAAERITGWRAEEAIGKHCCEVLAAVISEDGKTCAESCPIHLATQEHKVLQIGPMRLQNSRRGRKPIYIASSIAPVRSPGGATEGAVMVFRDMSREEELNQMKSTFISMVSHELKSPLAGISAASELLRTVGEFDPDSTRLLNIIHRQTDTLSHFIENVLNASFLQSGIIDVRRHPISVATLLERVVQSSDEDPDEHIVELVVPAGLPVVTADASKIEVVVRNLLQNALKYSPAGSRVTVEAGYDPEFGLVVSVSDEGIGIAAEHQARIFERFYRVGGEDAQQAKGCGLGLYIAKALVEANGGNIWVTSGPGKGSTFSFSLPVLPGELSEDEELATQRSQ